MASILTQFLLKFSSILAPFRLHLGSILGEKNRYFSNDAPRTDFYRFLPILDLIWGGFWTPDRLQDLKKYICWHFFAFTFAFGRLSTRTYIYFQQFSRNVRFYACLRIFARICSNCFKKSIMHTSPPRCHPQGHNARGTPPLRGRTNLD